MLKFFVSLFFLIFTTLQINAQVFVVDKIDSLRINDPDEIPGIKLKGHLVSQKKAGVDSLLKKIPLINSFERLNILYKGYLISVQPTWVINVKAFFSLSAKDIQIALADTDNGPMHPEGITEGTITVIGLHNNFFSEGKITDETIVIKYSLKPKKITIYLQ